MVVRVSTYVNHKIIVRRQWNSVYRRALRILLYCATCSYVMPHGHVCIYISLFVCSMPGVCGFRAERNT